MQPAIETRIHAMRRRPAIGISLLLAGLPIVAWADAPPASQPAPQPAQTAAPRVVGGVGAPASPYSGDAVVAIVKEVVGEKATFGNPPRVKVELLEVLRGDPKVDRTQAVWAPPDHGIDYGVIEQNPRYKEWASTPMNGPRVGEKYILWGWQVSNQFYALDRWVCTDEVRQKVMEMITRDKEAAREAQVKAAEEARKFAADRSAWWASIKDEDIAKWVAEADVVAITKGRTVVTEFLKGAPRAEYTDHVSYIAWARLGRDAQRFTERDLFDAPYVVFLSERGMVCVAGGGYFPVGEGLLPADDATLQAVREAVKHDKSPHRVTIALCGTLPDITMAQSKFQKLPATVLLSGYYLRLDPAGLKRGVVDRIKGVDVALSLTKDSGVNNFRAVAMKAANAEVIFDEHWPAIDEGGRIERLKATLLRLAK